jgi:hypothetical protein
MTYMSGALVRETGRFYDVTGALADPTAVTLKYKIGTGATQSVTFPGTIIRESVGTFHYDFDTTGYAGPGQVEYTLEWIGTGAVQAIVTDYFRVIPPVL